MRVFVGTSGPTDYLRGTFGDRRYWPPAASSVVGSSVDGEPRDEVVQRLLEATSGKWIVESSETCDGIHDEVAPTHYLCTRCFPDLIERALRGDLSETQDSDRDDLRRSEDHEME